MKFNYFQQAFYWVLPSETDFAVLRELTGQVLRLAGIAACRKNYLFQLNYE